MKTECRQNVLYSVYIQVSREVFYEEVCDQTEAMLYQIIKKNRPTAKNNNYE